MTTLVRRHLRALSSRLVLSRQSAMVVSRGAVQRAASTPARRVPALVIGVLLVGLGVAAYVSAGLGLPPYDVVLTGIATHLPVSHGQASWLMGFALFAVAAALGRRPSLGSIALVVLGGVSVDLFRSILTDADGLVERLVLDGLGLMLIAVGVAVIVHGTATGGPYELVMLGAADRGIDPARLRVRMDVGLLAVGVLAGGDVGVGTVAFALLMGPTLGLTLQAFRDHEIGRAARLTPAPTGTADAGVEACSP